MTALRGKITHLSCLRSDSCNISLFIFNILNLNTTLPIPWGIEYLNIVNSEFVRISLSKCLENKSKHNFTYSLRYNVIRGLAVLESVLEIIVLPLG